MLSVVRELKEALGKALKQVVSVEEALVVTPAAAKFNTDFISPIALTIFNKHKKSGAFGFTNPKALADKIHENLELPRVLSKVEVANNGFLNFFVSEEWLGSNITQVCREGQVVLDLDIPRVKTLVDFSSPNIAKEMHVGHLRSTIIGDSICRCLEFLGFPVMRVNHLGDWGTQFGMLLTYLMDTYPDWETTSPDISNLETFYKAAKKRFDEDSDFKERSRLKVVELQSGEEQAMKAWRYIYKVSREYLQIIYDRLEIELEDYGESFYNPMLESVTKELSEKGLVEESEGALCLSVKVCEVPLMMRKKDGGYGYDSTDLAAARYRLQEIDVKRVIYVTDNGQANHFYSIFEAAQAAGWHLPPETRMDHAGFGVVLGPDGKKFKTREGESVKLIDLLNEAKTRAKDRLTQRSEEPGMGQQTYLQPETFEQAAEDIGIAAIKYYDLRQNRNSSYKFEFEKMLDPRGNTAVYLLYAYARICSILDKAGEEAVATALGAQCVITTTQEKSLALFISRFPDVIETVIDELALHKLCDLIYEISVKFSEFYNHCKVIGSEQQDSRIQLCVSTKLTMKKIFELLGVKPQERL